MAYKLSVIAKNYWSSDFLKVQLEELFGSLFQISCHSPDTNPIMPVYNSDMILLHEPSVLDQMQPYIRCDCPVLLMRRTITADALERIKNIPEGATAVVVNLNDYMARETLVNIYQLGVKGVHMMIWCPESGEFPECDYIITPRIYDFLPDNNTPKILLGSRILDADIIMDILSYFNVDINAADEIIKCHMLKTPNFFHGVNYLLENNRFLSVQWELLFNKINKAIAVVSRNNKISSMNHLFEQYLGIEPQISYSLEEIALINPQLEPILSSNELHNELVDIEGRKFVLNIDNMYNKSHCIGKVITLELYNQIQSVQQAVHRKMVGKENVGKYTFEDILGNDHAFLKNIDLCKRIANSSSPVLIYGESGTGKELLASAIHNYSCRASQPYVAVNCAGIPNELMESEFFGYQEGAFTGAKRGGSIGLFERANGGTLFLDEVSEIPFNLQARLLRAIQEKEIRKVGANYVINIDVRIIAATNKDIYQMVEHNQFRRDLYYRLNVFPISLPSLRKRTDDIEMLCRHFLASEDASRRATKEFYIFARSYSWPGNIRELRNLIEFMCVTTDSDIGVRNLPDYLKNQKFFNKINYDEKISFCQLLMLKSISACADKGFGSGRRSLCSYFSDNYFDISEMETRKILDELEQEGLLIIHKGRTGCELTDSGRLYVG